MKKKRLLTLMALAVMAVGAWAQEPTPTPTMTLTVKNGVAVLFSEIMTLNKDKANHWSKSLKITTTDTNLTFTATYNNGGDNVESETCRFKVSSATTVTFYARYGTFRNKSNNGDTNNALVSCDAMFVSVNDAGWKALGTLPPSIGNTSVSTIMNVYTNTGLKFFDDTHNNPFAGTYFFSYKNNFQAGLCYNRVDNGKITVSAGETVTFAKNVYRLTLNYEECQITFEALNSYPLTISDAGAATLVLPYQVTLPLGLSAYTLTSDGSTTLTASKIAGGVIPAMTPVLINGPKNTYDLELQGAIGTYPQVEVAKGKYFVKDVEPDNKTNVLHGVLAPHYVLTDGYNYVLQNNGGSVGFYQVSGSTYRINPFRAFINLSTLPVDPSSARALTIVYDDENTTGVKNVKNTMAEGSNEIYNLSGQRVGKDYKGVVIKNGRKMIQK